MSLIKIIHMICQVKLDICMKLPKISVFVMLRQAFCQPLPVYGSASRGHQRETCPYLPLSLQQWVFTQSNTGTQSRIVRFPEQASLSFLESFRQAGKCLILRGWVLFFFSFIFIFTIPFSNSVSVIFLLHLGFLSFVDVLVFFKQNLYYYFFCLVIFFVCPLYQVQWCRNQIQNLGHTWSVLYFELSSHFLVSHGKSHLFHSSFLPDIYTEFTNEKT